MKTPPFLLLAALVFWGWMSGFLLVGALMGLLLESARFISARWELDDPDFSRVWFFCVLLNLALVLYVFTMNDETGGIAGMFHGNIMRNVSDSSVQTSTRFLRWLPMSLFALMAAQTFNLRPSVPMASISLITRWRQRRHKGGQDFAGQYADISYPYFMVCLFSSGIHSNRGDFHYFAGLVPLILWALVANRSKRYGLGAWICAITLGVGLAIIGSLGVNQVQRAIQHIDAQLMARFLRQRSDPLQTMTSMGRIGGLKLSAKIVIWLQPRELAQVPEYLREASYRIYKPDKMTWFSGDKLTDFKPLQPEPDEKTWVLLPGKMNNPAAVNISCYLNGWSHEDNMPEGLLPLPGGVRRLENVPPYMVMKRNQNGAVLAAGRGLVIFDAIYAGGATMDSPPNITSTNRLDLDVPTNEVPALEQVIAEMHLDAGADETQKLRAVSRFFSSKFSYSLWQGWDKVASTNATPLTKFLLTSRKGHCEYFASATVLLLRQLGIPARYAIGYAVHEAHGSEYVVRERDAHAWCLAWDEKAKNWVDFDTTPASWVSMENHFSAVGLWFSDARSWIGFQISKFRWRQAHLQQYILWSLLPVMVVLLYHIIFRRRTQRKRPAGKAGLDADVIWPGLDSEFYQIESRLAACGVLREPGEALADWLERALSEPSVAELRPVLQQLLRLHYRYRFDPHGLSEAERKSLGDQARQALNQLSPK